MEENFNSLNENVFNFYDKVADAIPDVVFGLLLAYIYLLIFDTLRSKIIKKLVRKSDDPLLIQFFSQATKVLNYTIAFLLFLYALGKTGIVTSILGAAGISAFIIGFAFKDIGENFLAGIILAFKRPFNLGDTIQSAGIEGVITQLNIRDTVLKTFDGKDVSIPNAHIIKNPLFNYTIDGFLRGQAKFTINDAQNIRQTIKLIEETVCEVSGVITDEKTVMAFVSGNDGTAVDISVNYWYDTFDRNHNALDMKSDITARVYEALQRENIDLVRNLVELKNFDDAGIKIQNSTNYDHNHQP